MNIEVYTSIIVPIILGLIASVATIIVAIINTRQTKKTNKKIDENQIENELNAIRNQILIMLLEDRQCIDKGEPPSNYQSICYLYDKYDEKGGNSYIKKKVQDYFDLVESLKVTQIKED